MGIARRRELDGAGLHPIKTEDETALLLIVPIPISDFRQMRSETEAGRNLLLFCFC